MKNLPLCTGNIPHFKYLHTYVANFITMTIFVLKLLGKSKARYLGSVKEGLGQKQKGPKFTSGCGCVSSKHFLFSLLLNIVLLYVIYSRIKTLYRHSFLSDVNQRIVNKWRPGQKMDHFEILLNFLFSNHFTTTLQSLTGSLKG